jgi:SAM-dependent methyltransferase
VAVLASKLLGMKATVYDISDRYRRHIEDAGLHFAVFDLTKDPPNPKPQTPNPTFDAAVLSEVIEHLPVPPYVALEKVRAMLRPRAWFVLTTPNLYSIRNTVYLLLGRRLFGHFFYPAEGEYCESHVVEYSRSHLIWQLERAGFSDIRVEFRQFHHTTYSRVFRMLYAIGRPLFYVPRFRQSLLAVARNGPAGPPDAGDCPPCPQRPQCPQDKPKDAP